MSWRREGERKRERALEASIPFLVLLFFAKLLLLLQLEFFFFGFVFVFSPCLTRPFSRRREGIGVRGNRGRVRECQQKNEKAGKRRSRVSLVSVLGSQFNSSFSTSELVRSFFVLHLSPPQKKNTPSAMADATAAAADDGAKRRTFRRFSYRGVDLEQLLELKTEEMVQLFGARQRRRYVFFIRRSLSVLADARNLCEHQRRESRAFSGQGARRGVRSTGNAVAATAAARRSSTCSLASSHLFSPRRWPLACVLSRLSLAESKNRVASGRTRKVSCEREGARANESRCKCGVDRRRWPPAAAAAIARQSFPSASVAFFLRRKGGFSLFACS